MRLTVLLTLILMGLLTSCAKYIPMTPEEIAARAKAYTECITAANTNVTVTDSKDAIIVALINKLPNSNDCSVIFTSGDAAQVEIGKSNNDTAKSGIQTAGSSVTTLGVAKITADALDSVVDGAGHNTTNTTTNSHNPTTTYAPSAE